jgi:gluconolactonase
MDAFEIKERRFTRASRRLLASRAVPVSHGVGRKGHNACVRKVLLPYQVSNLALGGPMKNRLFILASHTLYALFLNRRGVQWP